MCLCCGGDVVGLVRRGRGEMRTVGIATLLYTHPSTAHGVVDNW